MAEALNICVLNCDVWEFSFTREKLRAITNTVSHTSFKKFLKIN